MKPEFKIKANIHNTVVEEILVVTDEKGRKYFWNGSKLYRGIPIKGGRKTKSNSN